VCARLKFSRNPFFWFCYPEAAAGVLGGGPGGIPLGGGPDGGGPAGAPAGRVPFPGGPFYFMK